MHSMKEIVCRKLKNSNIINCTRDDDMECLIATITKIKR